MLLEQIFHPYRYQSYNTDWFYRERQLKENLRLFIMQSDKNVKATTAIRYISFMLRPT